jgi:hypothetical protein
LAWWWTGLVLGAAELVLGGAAELVLGVWAVHFWQRSLVTLGGVGHLPRAKRDLRPLLSAPDRQPGRVVGRLIDAHVS